MRSGLHPPLTRMGAAVQCFSRQYRKSQDIPVRAAIPRLARKLHFNAVSGSLVEAVCDPIWCCVR